VKKINEIKRT